MTRPSSGTGPRRRELRLPGRLRRRTSGVAQAISRRSRALGRADSGGAAPEPTIADAERRADAALVAADDALLASSEELAALADPDLPTVPGPDAGLAPSVATISRRVTRLLRAGYRLPYENARKEPRSRFSRLRNS